MSIDRSLNAAQGYLELGMPEEALSELDAIPEEFLSHAEILQLKLVILMQLRDWEEGNGVCEQLRKRFSQLTVGYIHGAFCLHELGRTKDAKALLLSGPPALLREATYHYNLGCYEAVLGNFEEAMQYLRTSFAMDHNFRMIAKRDPDLRALASQLEI
jgi:tetratricopeptide (TPR) repeat protein